MTFPEHPTRLPIDQLLADCDFERTRRGGPGGQHRNKVQSAIVVTHRPSGVIGQASERRSQHENRSVAIERLRLNLALALRQPIPSLKPTANGDAKSYEPTSLWRSRSRGGKLSVSVSHADYAAVLAEALDVLTECDFDAAASAKWLAVSTSQLLKLLKSTPAAFEWLNRHRQELGLNRLK